MKYLSQRRKPAKIILAIISTRPMQNTTTLVSAEELLKMPDDGFRYDLVRGILKKMSPGGKKHGKVAIKISSPLARHVEVNNLGEVYAAETGFKLASNPDTVRAPDVAFLSRKRVKKIGDIEGFIPGAPDLAVEVVSPSDSFSEVEEKVLEWLDSGTKLVIVADSRKRTLSAYRSRTDIRVLKEGDILDCSDVVPDWQLPVKGIFD
ncbi:Uma2 family endonuclease [bacterium]|nr:Uma2 family endonuclease [bacterium]